MQRELRENILVYLGFILALAILLSIGWLSWRNMTALIESDRWETHSYQVIRQFDRLFLDLKDMEAETLGFVITGDEKYLEPYHKVFKQVEGNLASLKELTRNDPPQQKRLEAIGALVWEKLEVMEETIKLRRTEGFRAASQLIMTDWGLMIMAKISTMMTEAQDEEERLLKERSAFKIANTREAIRALFAGSMLSLTLLVIVFIFLRREIARRARAEKELLAHRDHLEELVRERTKDMETFDYSVSHNLRAPLRSIDGFSQALVEEYSGKLGSEGEDYLLRLRASAQHMGQLIDDILALSRITREKIHSTEVDLSALVHAILESHERYDSGHAVETVVQDHVMVRGDKHLLRIAMQHLLDNAWKFTSRTPGARIEFGTREEDGRTVFFVKDNGVGFDTRYADKIFLPFQRLHSEAEFPGTGIGLPIVKRIMERHDGEIWAESEIGKGAVFYFTLGG